MTNRGSWAESEWAFFLHIFTVDFLVFLAPAVGSNPAVPILQPYRTLSNPYLT